MTLTVIESILYSKHNRKKRNKYSKISLKTKLIFFKKVIHQQNDLRDIAKRLGLKYSTAKTLIRNYRPLPQEIDEELINGLCVEFQRKSRPRRRCSYKNIEQQLTMPEEILNVDYWEWERLYVSNKIQIISNNIAHNPK